MNRDLARALGWARRSSPRRGDLARALTAGAAASLATSALTIGAPALLVASANRPGLRAVGAALVVIELVAFARSPLRYAERMSVHRLAFAAVARWRGWLVRQVGSRDVDELRALRTGDLLERALADTEGLQDLWLRVAAPLAAALTSLLAGLVALTLLAPRGRWWPLALVELGIVGLGAGWIASRFASLCQADRGLRAARGRYRASLVELSAVAPELALLGHLEPVATRDRAAREELEFAERRRQRVALLGDLAAPVGLVAAFGALDLLAPRAAGTWWVLAALVALALGEALAQGREVLGSLVGAAAAAERLEELEGPQRRGTSAPVGPGEVRLVALGLEAGGRWLVRGADRRLAPGRRVALTGPSGSGKTTLLEAVAGLRASAEGQVSLDGVALWDLEESALRARLAYLGPEPGPVEGRCRDVVTLGRTLARDPYEDLAHLGLVRGPDDLLEGLSRGEAARVALVQALAVGPRVLLLDEPTSALGPRETAPLLDLLARSGAAVLVATHDPAVIAWADEVWHLEGGSLL